MVSICCVGFACLDVVCNEHNDCAWNHGLSQLSDYYVYVYSVESNAHIECHSDFFAQGESFG